jgi:uncharacterized membrane protein
MAILFLGHMSPVESYIWLPLVIYFANRAVHAHGIWRDAIIAGALWGIQILAGAPQDAFYTFLAATLFLLCMFKGRNAIQTSAKRLLGIALTVFVVGTCFSAIQILPALELVNESVRAALDSYEWATLASYPLQGAITALLPHFFGNYADGSVWVSNTPWSLPQQNLYTGILTLVLLGFVSVQEKVEKRVIIFGGLLAIVSLILAFGHNTPIYKIVYLLPGFDRFRAPSKIMVLWVFSMSLLAGIGMDGLLSYMKKGFKRRLYPLLLSVFCLVVLVIAFHFAPSAVLKVFSPFVLADAIPEKLADAAGIILTETQRLALVLALILLLLLLLRRNFLSHRITTALLCALLLMDLAYVHRGAVRHDDSLYERIAKIRKDLRVSFSGDKSLYRVGAFTHPLGANLEMVLGYQTVGGFTALFPSRYYNYIDKYADYQLPRGWVSFFYGVSRVPVLMDLLNVKYEISYADKSIGLRSTCLPRAFIVPEGKVAPRQDILNLLTSSDFDPRKTVLFEKEENTPSPGALTRKPSLPDSDTVEIKTFRPDRMVLNTSSQKPGYLFLSEIHYPGWNAYIDDQRANILRGNYLFRVIPIPEGRHHILLHFDPLSIKLGMSISALAALVILGSLIHFSRRKRV